MNVISGINEIYTKTEWKFNADNEVSNINYGFVVEKVIVHVTPNTEENHYNSIENTDSADEVLEVKNS